MAANNRRRSLRAAAAAQAPRQQPEILQSEDSAIENLEIVEEASTTGDSTTANPPSLPDVSVTEAYARLQALLSNPSSSNLAPGVGGGNPLQNFLQPSSAPSIAILGAPSISPLAGGMADIMPPPQVEASSILGFFNPENVRAADDTGAPSTTAAAAEQTTSADTAISHVIVRDVPVLSAPVLSALPAIPAVIAPSPTLTSNSNVQNRNVHGVATPATSLGATSDVVAAQLQARYLLPHEKIKMLSKQPTHLEVLAITNELCKVGCPYTFLDVVPLDVKPFLVTLLQRQYYLDRAKRDDCRLWESWTSEKFCKELLSACPDSAIATPHGQASFLEQVSAFNFKFDLNDESVITKNDTALRELAERFPHSTADENHRAVKSLEKQLPTDPINWQLILRRKIDTKEVAINDIEDFRIIWWKQLKILIDLANELRLVGYVVTPGPHTRKLEKPISKRAAETNEDDQPPRKQTAKSVTHSTKPPPSHSSKESCTGCGRSGHAVSACRLQASPFFNNTGSAYTLSDAYKRLKKEYPNAEIARGYFAKTNSSSSASSCTTASNAATVSAPAEVQVSSKPVTKQKSFKKTRKSESTVTMTDVVIPSSILGVLTNPLSTDFLMATVSHVSQPPQPRNKVQVLVDTGALAGNFIAMRVVKHFNLEDFIVNSQTLTVCSALDSKCYNISQSINLKLTFLSERLNKNTFIKLSAIILNESAVDLVIGRKTIRETNIFRELPSQLTSNNLVEKAATEPVVKKTTVYGLLAALVLESERAARSSIPDDDEIEEHAASTFAPWLQEMSQTQPDDPLSLIL